MGVSIFVASCGDFDESGAELVLRRKVEVSATVGSNGVSLLVFSSAVATSFRELLGDTIRIM